MDIQKHASDFSAENLRKSYINNILNRNTHIHNFISMLLNIEKGGVIAIDGEWGSGKTYFVHQVKWLFDSANENIDLAEHAITNAQKISTNGVAPVYIGSVIEPSGTEGVKMTGVAGGGVAFVKPDSQNDYVPVYGGTPTDSNHLTNKQYVDKAIVDKFKAYLESEEGKAWIKTLLGISGG